MVTKDNDPLPLYGFVITLDLFLTKNTEVFILVYLIRPTNYWNYGNWSCGKAIFSVVYMYLSVHMDVPVQGPGLVTVTRSIYVTIRKGFTRNFIKYQELCSSQPLAVKVAIKYDISISVGISSNAVSASCQSHWLVVTSWGRGEPV